MTRRKIPLQQGHTYNKVKQTAVNFQQLRDNEEDDVSKREYTFLLSLFNSLLLRTLALSNSVCCLTVFLAVSNSVCYWTFCISLKHLLCYLTVFLCFRFHSSSVAPVLAPPPPSHRPRNNNRRWTTRQRMRTRISNDSDDTRTKLIVCCMCKTFSSALVQMPWLELQ